MMVSRVSKRRSVLITLSTSGGGDRYPVIALACGLKDRGDQVTVLCDVATSKLIASTGLDTLIIPPEYGQDKFLLPWWQELSETESGPDENTVNPIAEWGTITRPIVQETVAKINPDLIISTLLSMGLADALATHFGIPWCFVNPGFYKGENPTSQWDDDYYGSIVIWLNKSCFLPLSQRANIVLHATDQEFDFEPSQFPSNHHYVGFLLWEAPSILPEYINDLGDPWALITLSTFADEDSLSLARSVLWGLADHPVRSLLALADVHLRDKLGELPNNATVTEYVPHSLVLKQASIVVSHAGHGIVSKALYFGVPMVLCPWDLDQPGVAARAKALGVAKVVRRANVSPETVQQAVTTVLNNPKYRETATRVSARLKSTDAVDVAYRLLESF